VKITTGLNKGMIRFSADFRGLGSGPVDILYNTISELPNECKLFKERLPFIVGYFTTLTLPGLYEDWLRMTRGMVNNRLKMIWKKAVVD
jgi:hypothetical protein